MKELQEEIDRFALEQQIFACWNVLDDIQTVLEYVDNEANMSSYSADKIGTMLIGMKSIYEQKFNKVFSTFETLVSRGDLK